MKMKPHHATGKVATKVSKGKTGISGHHNEKVPSVGSNKASKVGLKTTPSAGPKKTMAQVHSRKVTKKAASPRKAKK